MGGGRDAGMQTNGSTPAQIADWYSERCEKFVYLARGDARKAARLSPKEKLRPSWCEACNGFHLAHVPPAVIRGETTETEYYDRARGKAPTKNTDGIDLRLPRPRIASRRWTAARQLRYDEQLLAAAWADRVTGGNRANPAWLAQRQYAGELLAWARGHLEELAEQAQSGLT